MPLGAVPFPFGICRICKDKATGLHYGVATCEGCKGFFKRSISKQEKFKCYFGGSCDVNPKTRSQCKACRFKRCLETGMSVDGVRMGRIPKIEKDKILEAFHDGGSHFSNHELVVQQTDEGNYKFKLNKTVAATNTTFTTTKDVTSDTTYPVVVGTDTDAGDDKDMSEVEAVVVVPLKVGHHTASASDMKEVSTEGPINNYASRNINIELSHGSNTRPSRTATINAPVHAEVSDKLCGEFSSLNKIRTCDVKDTMKSENCDNPFNDTYINVGSVNSKEIPHRIPQALQHQGLAHDGNKSFNKFCFSEQAIVNSFGSTTSEYDRVLPYNQDGACPMSSRNSLPPPIPSGSYQHDITRQRKNEALEFTFACKDDKQTATAHKGSTQCASMSTKQHQGDSDTEDQGTKRRSSFSPALINVLLEQVLESQDSVSVIAEKLHQKQHQGNFSHLIAQNFSHRLSEMSAKRRRYSDDRLNNSLPDSICKDIDSLEKYLTQQDLNGHVSLGDNDSDYCPIKINHDFAYSHNQYSNYDLATCRKSNSFTSMAPKCGDSCGCSTRRDTSICSRTVSSSSLNEEEEAKLQQIRNTLDGINIAMKVLNRLKAEHREKIRQHKLGKIKLRVMTDSDEDIKETYSKLINGIQNLNERILGFCNSVPGFLDASKEDQDVLMKRAYYDIWMLSYSEYIQGDESYLILETGEVYSQMAMRKILNDHMVDTIFEFANQFNSLELTDVEVAIICAARLTATDGIELSGRAMVNTLHSHILDVLAFEVKKNHELSHARKLIDIFRLMPLLETVNRIQRDIIAKFSV